MTPGRRRAAARTRRFTSAPERRTARPGISGQLAARTSTDASVRAAKRRRLRRIRLRDRPPVAAGAVVRLALYPARLGGRWCTGTFHGEIIESQRVVCSPPADRRVPATGDRTPGHRPLQLPRHRDRIASGRRWITSFPTGRSCPCPHGATGADAAAAIGAGLARAALAVKVDGELRDLARPLPPGNGSPPKLEILTERSGEDALALVRHDAAHVLAAAMLELYPGVEDLDRAGDRERLLLRLRLSRRRHDQRGGLPARSRRR